MFICHTSPVKREYFIIFFIALPLSSQNSSWYTVGPQKYLLRMNFFSREWMDDPKLGPMAHPMRKNKINPLLAFVWNRRGRHSTQPSIRLIGWTHHASVSKVIFCWISPCILKAKQFTFGRKKISLPASSLQNPLMAWVFLATEITSDYSVKCSSGESCMFWDACIVQLSNIHTVTILKERIQCREMGNIIKALGCIERRQPKESLLTYLIPGMGN